MLDLQVSHLEIIFQSYYLSVPQADVRKFVLEAMNRKEGDPIQPEHVPSPEEIARFEETQRAEDGPSIPNLRLDVATGKRASKWNKRAAILFFDYFHKQHGCADAKEKDVQRTFMTHLQTLHRHYSAAQQLPSISVAQNKIDKARGDACAVRTRNVSFSSLSVSSFSKFHYSSCIDVHKPVSHSLLIHPSTDFLPSGRQCPWIS